MADFEPGTGREPQTEVLISAIEHFSYCPRQCGLIHVEQSYADNRFTMRGVHAHARVLMRNRINLLVAYDVETTERSGQRRLRKVAIICQAFGQRVQNSVFECSVTDIQMEQLLYKLTGIIDDDKDNLRIYRLNEPKEDHVQIYGKRPKYDLEEPLIL